MAASHERITRINENDIICGRKGVALKHPGNLAYRKIVGLNKELYATCLKNEKLRISKSIVYAMREDLGGRFLEREDGKTSMSLDERDEDGNPVVWRDIGDKKAVEKTSQALREGQPKLLKKLAMENRIRDVPPRPRSSHPRPAAATDLVAETNAYCNPPLPRQSVTQSHPHHAAPINLVAETNAYNPYVPRQSITPPPTLPPPVLPSELLQLLNDHDKDVLLLALLMDRIRNGR